MNWRPASIVGFMLAALGSGCAGGTPEAQEPVQEETPADEILRVSAAWTSIEAETNILSPPSPLSLVKRRMASHIELSFESATERLTIDEEIELRSGGKLRCSTSLERSIELRYGRKAGEAAVELTSPPAALPRRCDGQHPEPTLELPPRRALFVVRADRLIAIEPRTDGRTYLPDIAD